MRRRRVAESIYRLLLHGYTAEFRDACGDELMGDFRSDLNHPRYRGAMGMLRLWRHVLGDWSRTVWADRRGAETNRSSAAGAPTPLGDPMGGGSGHDEPITGAEPRAWFAVVPLRQAARGLLRDPAYSMVAVVTLAVGMSATTVVFALVNGLLLTPLPLPEPERLVQIEERERDDPAARMAAYGNWLDVANEIQAFEEVALFAWDTKTLTGVDTAVRLRSRQVSENFFRMVGVAPALGRVFTPQEHVDGEQGAVVLSHALWSDAFGADESILGRPIELDATDYVVVGVMPAGFRFPSGSEIWVPAVPPAIDRMRRSHRFRMTGRLADTASLEQAREALDLLAERLEREFPETNENNYFAAYPLLDEYVGEARPALRLLSGAVGLVLLIACVNVTGLALARSSARRREIAMRRALGASRGRLAGLVLCEGLLVGAAGGLLALPLAVVGLRGLLGLAGDIIPRSENATMTAGVFVFAGLISLAAALFASLLPLVREAATGAATLVSDRVIGGPSGILGRRTLVIAEVALAVILVAGAGLLGRSLTRLTSVATGVDTEGVLTMDVSLPNGNYPERADTARFFDELLPHLASLPGVERAAVTLTPPAFPFGWRNMLTIRDRPMPENERPSVSYVVVSPGYFETLGIPVLAGRTFTGADNVEEARTLILNRTAADRFWPDTSPLGAMVLGSPDDDDSWMRVIGVVEDVRQSLFEPTIPEVYVPVAGDRVLSYVLVARTRGASQSAATAVRAAIADADPDIPVTGIMSLDERIGEQTTDTRLYAGLMSSFAAIALVLAAVGVYGVLSYSVSLRRREFGVRAAIGASRGRVMRLVLHEALVIAGVAVAAGTAAAVVLGRFMASLLFEVDASDPATLLAVAASVGLVTVLAALAPAWRAASADPLGVLRSD